jgi:hypothetical protein
VIICEIMSVWQSIDHSLTEDDTIVSKHSGRVIICEIIVHLLVNVQNNNRCTVQLLNVSNLKIF